MFLQVSFFSGEKKTSMSKKNKVASQTNPSVFHRPLSDIALKRMHCGESLPNTNSSQHLGSAVKLLAPTDLHSSLTLGKNGSGSNVSEPSVQLKRNLGLHHGRSWESWLGPSDMIGKITFAAVLGCIVFITFKLSGMNVRKMRIPSILGSSKPKIDTISHSWTSDSCLDYNMGPAYIRGSGIAGRMKQLLAMVKKHIMNPADSRKHQSSRLAASISTPMETLSRKQMPVGEAEALVKQWQAIKAEALGPRHQVHSLSEVLAESMLAQVKYADCNDTIQSMC